MLSKNKRIIVFDYYDGAIEGIGSNINGCQNVYFKMIAWDKKQDKRLYVIKNLDAATYDNLVNFLSIKKEIDEKNYILPDWRLVSESDRAAIDSIVLSIKQCLGGKSFIALGRGIDKASMIFLSVRGKYKSRLIEALVMDKISDLSDWLFLLDESLG